MFVCFRLQIRFNEMLKENKDFKSTSSLMERKVDELTEENGILSSQVMTHAASSLLNAVLPRMEAIINNRVILAPWRQSHVTVMPHSL